MSKAIARRECLKTLGGVAMLGLAGCSGSSGTSNRQKTSADSPGTESAGSGPPHQQPVELTFRDDQDFYKTLVSHLNDKYTVRVDFDGSHLITKKSPMLAIIRQCTNADEVWRDVNSLDNDQGRKDVLAKALAPELLVHEPLEHRADELKQTRDTLPNGEVIEPATVVLVVLIVLIVSGTALAATQMHLHGPIKARFIGNAHPLGVAIEFGPA